MNKKLAARPPDWHSILDGLNQRFRAAGVDPLTLPPLVPCRTCSGGVEDLEVSHDLMRDEWVVWCGCGSSTDAHGSAQAAFRQWNESNQKEDA